MGTSNLLWLSREHSTPKNMNPHVQKKIPPYLPKTMLASFAGCLLIAATALAQQDTNAPTKMKPTVVTGSLIPTAETVGPAPVNTLTSVDIQRGGQSDILSTLTKLDPSFSGGFNLGQV